MPQIEEFPAIEEFPTEDELRASLGGEGTPIPRSPEELAMQNFAARGGTSAGDVRPPGSGIIPEFRAPAGASLPVKVGAGILNTAGSVGNFFLSPEGVATVAAPEVLGAKLARPILKGVFTGLMARGAEEAVKKAKETGNAQDWTEAALAAAGAVGVAIPGRGLAGVEKYPDINYGKLPPPTYPTGADLPMPRGSPPWRRPAFQLPDAPKFEETKPVEPEATPSPEPEAPPVVTQGAPSFAAKYDPEILMQRPAWVDPGSKLDQVLGDLREKNDPLIGVNIAPIWKTLDTTQRQDLASRGWIVTDSRDPKAVILKLAQDVPPARKYYGVQAKQALRAPPTSPTEAPPPVVEARPPEPAISEAATVGKGKEGVATSLTGPFYYGDFRGNVKNKLFASKFGDYGKGVYVTPKRDFAARFASGEAFGKTGGSGKIHEVEIEPPKNVFSRDSTPLTPEEIKHWEDDGFDMRDIKTRQDLIDEYGGRNYGPEELRGQSEAWDDFLNKFGYGAVFDGDQLMLRGGEHKIKEPKPIGNRVGQFYEFTGDDALKASEITGKPVEKRGGQPTLGIVFHEANKWADKLDFKEPQPTPPPPIYKSIEGAKVEQPLPAAEGKGVPSIDMLDISREKGSRFWRATWNDKSPVPGSFYLEIPRKQFPTAEAAKAEFERQIGLSKQALVDLRAKQKAASDALKPTQAPPPAAAKVQTEVAKPKVGEAFARIGDYEFALIKGHIKERPDMYGIGVRRVGSTMPFESGGYGSKVKPEDAIETWANDELRRTTEEQSPEFKHPLAESKWKSESDRLSKIAAEKEAKETAEREAFAAKSKAWNEYKAAVVETKLPTGKKTTITATAKDGSKLTIEGTAYGDWLISKNPSKYSKSPYDVTHIPSGLRVSGDGFAMVSQAKEYIKALIHAELPSKWKQKSEIPEADLAKFKEVGAAWLAGSDVPSYFKLTEPTLAPPAATGEGMTKPEDHGIAASVRKKWTSATDDSPLGSEAGFISLKPLQDLVDYLGPKVRASIAAVKEAVGENFDIRKANDYRRAVFGWSAKLQRSFGEAAGAQREIREKVTDPIRRAGITNWIQAAGDATELARRKAATEAWRDPTTGKPHPKQKELVAGYDAALHLTPEELSVANDVKTAFNDLHARGTRYDVLHSFLDNYVTQQWDLGRSPKGMGTSRKLRDKFRFDKARKFGSYFEGEQAGYVPKTKDISSLLPMYLHEMNSVIAARQLVQDMSKGFASDGRPLLAPRGVGVAVDGPKGKATLILPGVPRGVKVGPAGAKVKVDTKDYVFLESQPALHEWVYATKDSAGNPVFNRADLVVHPEVATRFKNALGRSAIQEWYESRTSAAAAIPKAIVKGLDQAQSETKKTMLGFLTPFHQVQEGTHAIGHKVNPFFNNPEIDLVNNPAQMDAARHGLMLLPDRASAQNFMEGFRQSGLLTKIPIIGPLADHYSYYLFHEYIPGIKFKTYEAILKRNSARYASDIAAGRATLEDVKILSAEQANAAYGHLNYADLGRNPTIQHLMRLGLLAPDFLEARARFAGQAINGLSGEKIGREQLIALATLAIAQATLSWTMAQITGGQWDAKDPFTFHVGNRKFTMRSVPEDLYRSVKDHRAFWYARLNPIIGRGAIQYLSGTDWRGQKVGAGQTTKELLTQPVPLALRPLVGLGNTPLSSWEEIAGASGLKISRYSNVGEVSKMAHSWMASSPNPKIRAAEERYQHTSFPDSDYKPLREALIKGDMSGARTAYKNLLKTRPPGRIMQTFLSDRPFTGSREAEAGFVASLSDKDRALYESARRERRQLAVKLQQMLQGQSGGTIPSFVPTVQQR